ncbi:conserved hypothetical protein [Pseudomonas sp. 8AS]|uniref:hypothetical protein n=1 Tax=Pseudomonas sp. 8AS TaxID=2653163 RepID=UPI0012F21268|nr:hypothetical protein [Pseudomonas sp. 8AS]VXA92907.1 conserved hypothetical protein [Pseudomonas sp. 8AS]
MAEPQPTLGGNTQEHGTTRVSMSVQQDYVTVVGASHSTLMEDIRGQMGNKMRFINQGIRQLRKYPEGKPDFSVQRVFLVFVDDYERQLLDELRKVVEGRYGAQYREYDNISQLVDFILSRQRRGREIRQLDFFSHGVVGSIELGYELDKRDSYRLRDAQARRLVPEAFAYDGKIFSYACRTGLGIDAHLEVAEGEDPQYERSLAQMLANAAGTEVRAYPRRSNYDQTYGNAQDRAQQVTAQNKVAADDRGERAYQVRLSSYRKRVDEYRKDKGDPAAALPNESEPRRPTPSANDYERDLARHANSRKKYETTLGYPLDAEGAMRDVRSGDTPRGLPDGLRSYLPL